MNVHPDASSSIVVDDQERLIGTRSWVAGRRHDARVLGRQLRISSPLTRP